MLKTAWSVVVTTMGFLSSYPAEYDGRLGGTFVVKFINKLRRVATECVRL